MMRKTHFAVGLAVTIPIIVTADISIISLLGLVGANMPDWDIKLHMKHRGVTHSILCLLLLSMFAFQLSYGIGLIFFSTYLSHLLLDSFTVSGVPLFYPFKKRYGPRLVKTRGAADYSVCLLAWSAIALFFNKL